MEELINEMSSLIYKIAREFTTNNDLINDLYNQGVLGIYDAYNNYDNNSNTKFSSYAYMYIYGKMYSYMYSNRNIKLNKENVKLYKLIKKTKDYLSQVNFKEPSINEISTYLNIDENIIINTLNMFQETLSLDYEYDDSNILSFAHNNNYDDITMINDLLSVLDDEQKKVIMYKYYSGYSQSEIAAIMNMSQSGVSRCEKKSIEKMRVRSIS